jgi:hypothetical protein
MIPLVLILPRRRDAHAVRRLGFTPRTPCFQSAIKAQWRLLALLALLALLLRRLALLL